MIRCPVSTVPSMVVPPHLYPVMVGTSTIQLPLCTTTTSTTYYYLPFSIITTTNITILTQPSAFSPKNRTQDNNRSQPIFLMQFSSYWILGSTSLNDYWAAVTAQKLVEEVAKMLAGSLPRSVRPIVLTPTINSHTNNRSQPAIVLRKQRNVLRNQNIQETFSTLSIVLSGGGLRFESSMKFQKSSWEGCSLRMGKVVIWSFKMPPRTFSAIIVLRWIFELYWTCRWSFPSISPKGENVVVGSNGGLPTINLSSACFQRTLQFR